MDHKEVPEPITFEEFEKQATAILEDHKNDLSNQNFDTRPVLFRGHGKASYKLQTSLERYSTKQYSGEEYWYAMHKIKTAIETCTGKSLDFPNKYSLHGDNFDQALNEYAFMVYLRHHGFPSPFLDWTKSFYIAAFFAFRFAQTDEEPNVVIYSYDEGIKIKRGQEATIKCLGPHVKTHKRHYNQQSKYTYCMKQVDGKDVYCNHEEAFARKDDEQDVLKKFIIPKTESPKILERLSMMNITAYSLFGSEESLLETLAYQEIK